MFNRKQKLIEELLSTNCDLGRKVSELENELKSKEAHVCKLLTAQDMLVKRLEPKPSIRIVDIEKNYQCSTVLEHLKKFGSISQAEATKELHIRRLSARIFDLRNSGVEIATHKITEKVQTRGGKTRIVNFAKYTFY